MLGFWKCFAVLLLCLSTQGVITLDRLSVPQAPLTSTGGEVSSVVPGASIMGGDRELIVSYSGTGSITSEITGGEWVTTVAGMGSHLATLRWDGTGNAANTRDLDLAPIDLTAGGGGSFRERFSTTIRHSLLVRLWQGPPADDASSCFISGTTLALSGDVGFGYDRLSGNCDFTQVFAFEWSVWLAGPGTVRISLLQSNGCNDSIYAPVLSGCSAPITTLNTNPGTCCASHTFSVSASDLDRGSCAGPLTPVLSGRPSGTCFIDNESVAFEVSDNGGNSDSCSWQYDIVDNERPSFIGCAAINRNTDFNQCFAVLPDSRPFLGLQLWSGSTAIAFEATDTSGNTASCNFSVDVSDAQAPSVTCPGSQMLPQTPGTCEAPVTYTVTSSDNCPSSSTLQLSGFASGSAFPVGTTTNQFQAVDAASNLSTMCSFDITVLDNEQPTVTCPADLSLNTEPGLCSAITTFSVLSSDNCPGETLILRAGLASGSSFPLGTTLVGFDAVDSSNNVSPTCNFNVVVVDNQNPTITCPADITVNANSNGCSALVMFAYTVTDNCPSTVVTSSHESGSQFVGVTDVIGTATDGADNFATCSFRITVVDSISPTIVCYSASAVTDPGVCSATVFFRDPDAFDVCGVSIDSTGSAVSGASYVPGTYFSTFTATDPSSNTASCTSTVSVVDAEPPHVAGCPSDIEVTNAAGCDEPVTWDDSTVVANDNCGVVSTSQSHTPGSVFPRGLTAVSYSAHDATGNVGQCSFVVRVVDTQRISYTGCPADMVVASSCSDSGTVVSWQQPTVAATCLSYETRNFVPGTRFPDGVTTISYVAVADEEFTTCLFDITVEPCPAENGGNRPPGAIGTIDFDGDGYYSDAPLLEWRDCCDSPEDLCDDPFLVNPGAFEIAANGQLDSCRGTSRSGRSDVDGHIGGCDREFVSGNNFQLVGPTIPSEQTSEAVWALDLCEFKEDDDDPSWGFDEQHTMVFSLANGTRNGYDIGIVGPATTQAAVVDHFGGIVPARGDFMLAISSGTARDETTSGHLSPAGATTGNTIVNLPASFLDSGASAFVEDCGDLPYAVGVDSIRAHFRMRQPTNMHAFSFQALYLDFELEAAQGSYPALGGSCDAGRKSWFLAVKSDSTTGVSGNFAGDSTGRSFNSFNANSAFWSQCDDFGDSAAGVCRDGATSLELTGFTGASNWTPIGTSADPGETFSLEFVTFDGRDGANDVTVLLDDFFPITEARTAGSSAWASQPWGYQYTADLETVHFGLASGSPLLSKTASSVTLEFTLRNWGPEEANDVTISFTPPLGARFTAAKDATGTMLSCTTQSSAAPFQDNSFVKCKWPANAPLANQATLAGTLTFELDLACASCPAHTAQMRFRLTATLSSIDRQLSNNYLTTDITFI